MALEARAIEFQRMGSEQRLLAFAANRPVGQPLARHAVGDVAVRAYHLQGLTHAGSLDAVMNWM